jgi:hypothetical protein
MMTTTETKQAEFLLVTDRAELTLQDRCDACAAAAKVVFKFLNGELMFCNHHANKKRNDLLSKSISIFDPQNILNIVK